MSVKLKLRVERFSRMAPVFFSGNETCLLTADLAKPKRRAAPEKLPERSLPQEIQPSQSPADCKPPQEEQPLPPALPRTERTLLTRGSSYGRTIKIYSTKFKPGCAIRHSARRCPSGCGSARVCSPRRNRIMAWRAHGTVEGEKSRFKPS